jgi:hypothetical protein
MQKKPESEQYSDAEATRRMEDALRRALNTRHKPHSEMKVKKKSGRGKRTSPKAKKPS